MLKGPDKPQHARGRDPSRWGWGGGWTGSKEARREGPNIPIMCSWLPLDPMSLSSSFSQGPRSPVPTSPPALATSAHCCQASIPTSALTLTPEIELQKSVGAFLSLIPVDLSVTFDICDSLQLPENLYSLILSALLRCSFPGSSSYFSDRFFPRSLPQAPLLQQPP